MDAEQLLKDMRNNAAFLAACRGAMPNGCASKLARQQRHDVVREVVHFFQEPDVPFAKKLTILLQPKFSGADINVGDFKRDFDRCIQLITGKSFKLKRINNCLNPKTTMGKLQLATIGLVAIGVAILAATIAGTMVVTGSGLFPAIALLLGAYSIMTTGKAASVAVGVSVGMTLSCVSFLSAAIPGPIAVMMACCKAPGVEYV